jgi:hypothetical protein
MLPRNEKDKAQMQERYPNVHPQHWSTERCQFRDTDHTAIVKRTTCSYNKGDAEVETYSDLEVIDIIAQEEHNEEVEPEGKVEAEQDNGWQREAWEQQGEKEMEPGERKGGGHNNNPRNQGVYVK